MRSTTPPPMAAAALLLLSLLQPRVLYAAREGRRLHTFFSVQSGEYFHNPLKAGHLRGVTRLLEGFCWPPKHTAPSGSEGQTESSEKTKVGSGREIHHTTTN